MSGAIYDAINNAGAFEGMEESEVAQYVSDTSKLFANQVLAEANKRGCSIDGVLKASDIKFENGKIRLQAGKETIAETPIVQMDVNAEIVTDDTVKMDENGQIKLFQSMYKDTTSKNIANFVDNANNNKNEYKKAKFQIKDLKLSLPADIVRHDLNEHNLTAENWQELEENIENIYIANKANGTSSYGNNLYVFGVKTQNDNYYYLCVAMNNKDNYIVTAVKDHKNTVESYVTGKNNTPSKVPNALPPVAPFSKESSDNIITYLKDNLNPDELNQLTNLPKQKKVYKGSYNVSEKAIELFKTADFSTLPHEFAHFWLDNMWEFSRSGRASEAYMNNFNSVLDWLGVKESQTYFTKAQQEKFAKGYEKPQKCTK